MSTLLLPPHVESSHSGFSQMSKETWLECKANDDRLMAEMIDQSLHCRKPSWMRDAGEVRQTVRFRERFLRLRVGRIDIAYSWRSFECSPGVWFATMLSRLFAGLMSFILLAWRIVDTRYRMYL